MSAGGLLSRLLWRDAEEDDSSTYSAEEFGPSGEALGNFPQAFTHLTLISAAFNLDRALGTSSS